jgi:hypothetical protein
MPCHRNIVIKRPAIINCQAAVAGFLLVLGINPFNSQTDQTTASICLYKYRNP